MYGFVLLPDKLTEAKLITVNNTLFPEPLKLDAETHVPHVTVLQAPLFPGFNPAGFLETFKQSYPLRHEPKAKLGELQYVRDYWMFFNVENPDWLQKLNALIVEEVRDYIDVAAAPTPSSFATEAEQQSYNLTGYKYNLDAYNPHFTMGVGEDLVVDQKSGLEGLKVPFRKLAFCKHGEFGQVDRIIDSVSLPFSWDW